VAQRQNGDGRVERFHLREGVYAAKEAPVVVDAQKQRRHVDYAAGRRPPAAGRLDDVDRF